jgi:hypothetical protein
VMVPAPDPVPQAQPLLWSPSFSFQPAQNIVQIGGGFLPAYRTNVNPWASAQRSLVVVPARSVPSKTTPKQK